MIADTSGFSGNEDRFFPFLLLVISFSSSFHNLWVYTKHIYENAAMHWIVLWSGIRGHCRPCSWREASWCTLQLLELFGAHVLLYAKSRQKFICCWPFLVFSNHCLCCGLWEHRDYSWHHCSVTSFTLHQRLPLRLNVWTWSCTVWIGDYKPICIIG